MGEAKARADGKKAMNDELMAGSVGAPGKQEIDKCSGECSPFSFKYRTRVIHVRHDHFSDRNEFT